MFRRLSTSITRPSYIGAKTSITNTLKFVSPSPDPIPMYRVIDEEGTLLDPKYNIPVTCLICGWYAKFFYNVDE